SRRTRNETALMILVLGSSVDGVYPKLVATLREAGYPYVAIDEEHAQNYQVQQDRNVERPLFRIRGNGSNGQSPVGAIFVRHAMVRTLDQSKLGSMSALQLSLNQMLLTTDCPVSTIRPKPILTIPNRFR